MKKEKVEEIMQKVITEWEKRHGKENIDPMKIEGLRTVLSLSPHDDGLMRVTLIEDGKTRLVPMEKIILEGLEGKDIENFPLEEK